MKKILLPFVFCIALALSADDLETQAMFPAELMLRAYKHCYPGKIGAVLFQNGDWTVTAGNETYYWAGGRLLPASLKDRAASYSPLVFEIYPDEPFPPEKYPPRYIEALRAHGDLEAMREAANQHMGFQGAIFGGPGRVEIESHLQKIIFLGRTVSVHEDIAGALGRVDAAVSKAAAGLGAESAEIAAFIQSIGQMGGYNWREIRSSNRMSYHSWGLAIDIQPAKTSGKAIYWLWEKARTEDWMLIPLAKRWTPPAAVIEAFEREGFVWGGKWALYDTMHFEYRPEHHELKRLLADSGVSEIVSRAAGRDLHHLYPDGLEK